MSDEYPDTDTLLKMYACMWRIRHFEEAAGRLYKQGLIKGGIHAGIGQEAVAVGVAFALQPGDWFASTHRGHSHHIAAGADLNRLMAEVRAKETGWCHGRGGSMHVAAFEVGSLGAYPVVGAGIPIALGAALTQKMRGTDRVAVTYFGDGALGQGTLYECLNLASIWKLPVLFMCENNHFAVATSYEDSSAVRDLLSLAKTFNLPGIKVDGQEVLAVHAAAGEAIARARRGGGPTLVEADTYRFEGHYFGEPQVYRTREEVEEKRRSRDPIPLFEKLLLEKGVAESRQLRSLAEAAAQQVDQALKFAEESPSPLAESSGDYVYA